MWPDWAIVCFLGKHSKPVATIKSPKSPTLLGNFCKRVKINLFSCEIIFGQLLKTFGYFFWSPCLQQWRSFTVTSPCDVSTSIGYSKLRIHFKSIINSIIFPFRVDSFMDLTKLRVSYVRRLLYLSWAVVALLVKRSLPTWEVCGSNPVIGKLYNVSMTLMSQFLERFEKRLLVW